MKIKTVSHEQEEQRVEKANRPIIFIFANNMIIKATQVIPVDNMKIKVMFNDGEEGVYTIQPKNSTSILNKLYDYSFLKKAKVGYNGSAIVRDKEIDLDARKIYMDISKKSLYG